MKVPIIKDSRAELSVIASNGSKWSNYAIQLTNSNKTITLNFSRAVNPENDTTVPLSPLDPETVYMVRVTPVQDDGEELPEWANEVSFKTRKLDLNSSPWPVATKFVCGEASKTSAGRTILEWRILAGEGRGEGWGEEGGGNFPLVPH